MRDEKERQLGQRGAGKIFVHGFPIVLRAEIIVRVGVVIFLLDGIEKAEVKVVVNEQGGEISVITLCIRLHNGIAARSAPVNIGGAPGCGEENKGNTEFAYPAHGGISIAKITPTIIDRGKKGGRSFLSLGKFIGVGEFVNNSSHRSSRKRPND